MLRKSTSICVLACLLLMAPPAWGHRLEPISTEFARPFAPKTGSLQINYEFERRDNVGISTHLIPEAELELGITRRMQVSASIPVIREKPDALPATTGAGHIEFGVRYLLTGGEEKHYAVSLNAFVSPPTGNRTLADDATEAGVAVHIDREFGERAFFHGNYGWSTTIGGTASPERLFFHRTALVVPLTRHWNPAIELLGQTDTATRDTEIVVQPEMIYYINPHWELKLGIPIGITKDSPQVGVRAQVMWIFGGRGSHAH